MDTETLLLLLLLLTSQVLHSLVQHHIQQLIIALEHTTDCSTQSTANHTNGLVSCKIFGEQYCYISAKKVQQGNRPLHLDAKGSAAG